MQNTQHNDLVDALRRISEGIRRSQASDDPIARVAGRIALDAAVPRKKEYFVQSVKSALRRKGKEGKAGGTIGGVVRKDGDGVRNESHGSREKGGSEGGVRKDGGKGGLVNPVSVSHNARTRTGSSSEVVSRRPSPPGRQGVKLDSKAVRGIISKNCSLIKTVDADLIPGIERRIKRIYEGTSTPETLTRYLEDVCDLEPHRAELIVRDQMQKYEAMCHAEKLRRQGVRLVRWVHGGSAEPREWHVRKAPHGLNGLVFDIDNPPVIDPETGERGLPGQLIGCQCRLVAVR